MPSPLRNKLPELPPNPYLSAPEQDPSETLEPDNQTNLPPPSYEEAIDPTFMQRVQKFTPEWPGFHPAGAPRLARQLTRQLSRNNPDPENQTGETDQEEEIDGWFFTMLYAVAFIVLKLTVLCLLVGPIAMIGVGSYYFEECDKYSPYQLWLIVGGVSTIVAFSFVCCLSCSETDNCCLYLFGILLLLVPFIWFFFGCYYVWGLWDRYGDLVYGYCDYTNDWKHCGSNDRSNWDKFQNHDCVYPYYFSYALVVAPFGLLGLVVFMFFLTFCYGVFSSCEDDQNDQNVI